MKRWFMLLQLVQSQTHFSRGFDILLMFSQTLFMSSLPLKFSKAANLFEILIWYYFLTSSSISFLRLNFSIANLCCLLTYCQSFPNFPNHQRVVSITVSSPERSYIMYTQMPSPIYQYVIEFVVSIPIRWSWLIYEWFGVGTSCS